MPAQPDNSAPLVTLPTVRIADKTENSIDGQHRRNADLGNDDDNQLQCPSHTTKRKLMARIDFRVIPFLCIMYLFAFLDRINISNANIFGLSQELTLDGLKYNTALVIFFVPYIVFEIPSNIIMKKLRPPVWLSLCMFMFGLVTLCQGFVTSYSGLLATRFFLGFFETGMFPGCFYLIGMWYTRPQAQKRYTFFFNSTSLAGAFGGLLASAIGKMDGIRGYRGWRWIFILEGLLTCLVGIALFFWLPDFPEEAKWLTKEERDYLQARLRMDQGHSARDQPVRVSDIINVLKDSKIIIGGLMYFGLIVPAYGYAYFSPAIIQSYGYTRIQTQLLSVPPWAASFCIAMVFAVASDKRRHRFSIAVFAICIGICGFATLISVHNNRDVQYGALFLVTMGIYGAMPITVCWFAMNCGGHHRRSVGTAWQVGFGNIGAIISVYAFLSKDAPRYTKGYALCIAFTCLSGLACIAYFLVCSQQNKQRQREPRDVHLTEDEKTELGDLSPDFKYFL